MGVHQKGSHFPICVFTNNVGRRSPQKLEERKEKQKQIPWYVGKWSESSRTKERQSRTKEWQGLQEDADPQQGEQPRPEEDMADSFGPWKDYRCGRRSGWQTRNSGTRPSGTWPQARGHNAAVAASEPMKVASSMETSNMWSGQEPQCPARALRDVVRRGKAIITD